MQAEQYETKRVGGRSAVTHVGFAGKEGGTHEGKRGAEEGIRAELQVLKELLIEEHSNQLTASIGC